MTPEEFNERMKPINDAFMRKVADGILRPNRLVEFYYLNSIPRKKPTKLAIIKRRMSRTIGQVFLKAANAFGEYNDCD